MFAFGWTSANWHLFCSKKGRQFATAHANGVKAHGRMKIIVYNSKDQYALSRKQIERICEILPNEYFSPIREFHLAHSPKGAERFEYTQENKQVHFYFPVEQKTLEIVDEAVSELLVGLARIKVILNGVTPLRRLSAIYTKSSFSVGIRNVSLRCRSPGLNKGSHADYF